MMHDATLSTPADPAEMSPVELKRLWSELWDKPVPPKIGRVLLIKSVRYKLRELAGQGPSPEQQTRLAQLIKQYRRNPTCFDEQRPDFKPGTQLVRIWKGEKYTVITTRTGFDYKGTTYTSLSEIASTITGTRWNGWVFFGVKKKVKP